MINNIPLIPISFFILMPFVISILFKNKIMKNFDKLFLILSITILVLEIFRVIFLILTNNFDIRNDMSIQLCFLYPFICIIAIITKKSIFYDYIASSSLLFGIGAILIFSYDNSFFTFNTINNYVFHSIIIFIGLIFKTNNYIINFKNIIYILLIFFSQLLLAHLVNIILGSFTNYMFIFTIFNPENNIYHTETLDNFYSPTLFKYSLSHYLVVIKDYLGYINYYLFIIFMMITNYFICLIPFRNKKY